MDKKGGLPIVKHNRLIETSYKLNSREQFFVLYLISQISKTDSDFREYKMHYTEIEQILNFDGKRRIANKQEVFQLMDKLNSEPIVYEKGTIVGKSVWLQHMEHNTETDEFTFSLSEKLREYLLQLKEHFTKYSISNVIYLNASAIRIYELLKRYQFQGEFELTVEKMKFYLGIEDRYPKFYEFKRWVLTPAQEDIEKYTDIRFEFKPVKKDGKRILSLKFFIYDNEPSHQPAMNLIARLDQVEEQKGSYLKLNLHQEKVEQLTRAQRMAYDFLVQKNVNKAFIVDKVLQHAKIKYEVLQGFEDIYIQQVWNFFIKKSNAQNQAGAFVSWWKEERLTEDALHAQFVEQVQRRKKQLDSAAFENRLVAKTMTAQEFLVFFANQKKDVPANQKSQSPTSIKDILG